MKGLTTPQAQKLLREYGQNRIEEYKKRNSFLKFADQFNNLLIILLIGAGCLSLIIGKAIDSLFIFLIVFLNAGFGFYQEFKAEHILEKLKNIAVTKVRVLRDGVLREIDNHEVVPGDVVYVEEGSKIPADGQLFDAANLEVNEASLTGESYPVVKSPTDPKSRQVYMGTIVARGHGYIQIEKTGSNTKFGQLAKQVAYVEQPKTPLRIKLDGFTKQIGIFGIIASLVVFLVGVLYKKSLFDSFFFATSLAVAIIPEGLPAVMTVTLAVGVERMAKKRAIARKLSVIEDLGSITLIATDKTGTLTTNKMEVKSVWIDYKLYSSSKAPNLNPIFSKILLNSILCSTASLATKRGQNEFDVIGDATEGALLKLAAKRGLQVDATRTKWKIVDEIPFDSKTKMMSVSVSSGWENYTFVKGAFESVLECCTKISTEKGEISLNNIALKKIRDNLEVLAKQGYRMLAFSYKQGKDKNLEASDLESMVFLGFVAIADPLRAEVSEAVLKAQKAGIKIVMITGDSELTAATIAYEAGIIKKGEDVLLGHELEEYSDEELLPILSQVKVFARTSAEHKLRLVRLLQKQKEVVAVTGDGVNDILALKQAQVGVAMGLTGTDVAREASDLVITDDNFATIVAAIEEGRGIFANVKNAIKYLFACNFGEMMYILPAVFLNLPILTPLQILYINLVTDGLPAISLAFSPKDKNVMRSAPRRLFQFLDSFDYFYIYAVGALTAVTVFISLLLLRNQDLSIVITFVFTLIVLYQHLILADLWVSHRFYFSNFHLFLSPIFIAAFILPFVFHPFLLYNSFLQKVFKIAPLGSVHIVGAIALSITAVFTITVLNRMVKSTKA